MASGRRTLPLFDAIVSFGSALRFDTYLPQGRGARFGRGSRRRIERIRTVGISTGSVTPVCWSARTVRAMIPARALQDSARRQGPERRARDVHPPHDRRRAELEVRLDVGET